MFVAIQFPFADLRPFVAADAGRLRAPSWPDPRVDVEFVRSVGTVRERRRGGLDPWAGESYYAEAVRALRFPPGFARWPLAGGRKSTSMHCIFRRYYCDGMANSRIEVGFAPRSRWELSTLSGDDVLGLVAGCLAVPVQVPAPGGPRERELVSAGRAMADHLLMSTSRTAASELDRDWLAPMRPAAVVEYQPWDICGLPSEARRIEVEGSGGAIHHMVIARGAVTVPVWLIPEESEAGRDFVRRLRLHLFRLHAEREVLRYVLGAAKNGLLAGAEEVEPWDRLQAYLNDTLGLLERGSVHAVHPTPELKFALGLDSLIRPTERSALLMRLEDIRGNVLRKLERAPATEPNVTIVYIEKQIVSNGQIGGITTMGDDKSVSTGDILGPVEGAIGNDITITDSFKVVEGSSAPEELKGLLRDLIGAVETLKPSLDGADRETAERDLESLVAEATSDKPRRGILEALGDGLTRAARVAGDVGIPVIKAVTGILALLA